MRLEHHLVGGYVRYISPHIIIIISFDTTCKVWTEAFCIKYQLRIQTDSGGGLWLLRKPCGPYQKVVQLWIMMISGLQE